MNTKKTGMFTGCKEVFSFTASQATKGNGFKGTTIFIALVIFAVFILINVISANIQMDDEKSINEVTDTFEDVITDEGTYDFKTIKEVFLVNETKYSDEQVRLMLSVTANNFNIMKNMSSIKDAFEVKDKKDAVVLNVTYNENFDEINVNLLRTYESNVSEEEMEVLGEFICNDAQFAALSFGQLTKDEILLLQTDIYVDSCNANENGDTVGTTVMKVIVPMVFCLFMYMIILIHGQSISKSIVADKASKLMEMLLTSVKPYALIAGKVFGTAVVAIIQLAIWILAGIAGFYAGDIIGGEINPNYHNSISELFSLMQNSSQGTAFSTGAICLSIMGIIIGFLIYCVLAGLSGAMVSKVEDLSSAATLFQLPVVVAFMVAYFATLSGIDNGGQGILLDILRIVPITSPFLMPADILIGNMTLISGIISLAVMIITCLVVILITGKIYKNKIFNKH